MILIVIVIALISTYLIKGHLRKWKLILALPGPLAFPVVGHISEMFSEQEKLFLRERRRSKRFFPIYKLWTIGISIVILLSPEDIELVLGNVVHNEKNIIYGFLSAWLGTGLLTSAGSKWRRRRKILTPAFHFSILQQFIEIFNTQTDNLVKVLEEKCHEAYVDVVHPITDLTLYSLAETSLGVNLNEDSNCERYKKAIHDFGLHIVYRLARPWLYPAFTFNLTSRYKTLKSTTNILHNFSKTIIKERQNIFFSDGKFSYSQGKKMAMLDLMLKAKYEGADLDDEGIREEVDTFMFEGHDTTSMALCFTLMLIANEQKIQEEVYREIMEVLGDSERKPTFNDLGELKLTERCLKECLRIYPSVPVIGRLTGEEFKTRSGYIIPKKTIININIYDLHHDPRVWENPEKFDPDRFLPDNNAKRHPYAYLPFSAGSRNCIGQRFAFLEMKAVLCGILRKFKLEAVDTPENIQLKSDLVMRPRSQIRVKFVPRK